MNVLIAGGGTGGHLVPTLAIADELARRGDAVRPFIVGAERGIESTILPDRQPAHPYQLVPALPLYRRQWWKNIRTLWTGPAVLRTARRILVEVDPRVIVCTGGYAAGVITWLGARRGIPLCLQEQNAYPGFTTRRLAPRAREVYLGYPEAADRLAVRDRNRLVVTGNPVARPVGDRATARADLGIAADARVCLVMGGSQGARAINHAVASALDSGSLDGVVLLWATGPGHYEGLRHYDRPPDRQVRGFWDPIAPAYAAADVVICRSGAMTTAELEAWGLPAILIPLPTAAADHQTANARALEAAGAARWLPESALDPEALVQAARALLADDAERAAMSRAARARGKPDATERIVDRILAVAG